MEQLLQQSKLSKSEWESIEVPVSPHEKRILELIDQGYTDVHIQENDTQSLFSFVKIEITPENELFLYQRYFAPLIQETIKKYGKSLSNSPMVAGTQIKKLKSADSIRIANLETNIQTNRQYIFEYLIIELCSELLKLFKKSDPRYGFYLYTLLQLKKASVRHINAYVIQFMDKVIEMAQEKTDLSNIVDNAYDFIEKNPYLMKYEDKALFEHQKQLFAVCKNNHAMSKLILYTAPTGTGKTLSPIGLATDYRIIFVCVARHIGLALAKSAISVGKRVAFAFGCESAADIRLHYFAAADYTKNYRSGGIWKVDNDNGSKVEIMICDVRSYLTAMHYMVAFNPNVHDIITYWDEPTITMDYEDHDLHAVIHRNWSENKIPNIVLSCATLPHEEEIMDVLGDFRAKFEDVETFTITSFDCRKSIPVLNKDGYAVLPHLLYADYSKMQECVDYCEKNKTLLRYFELREIIRFIRYLYDNHLIKERFSMDNYFDQKIQNITMISLKLYYLVLMKQLDEGKWNIVHQHMTVSQCRKYSSTAALASNLRKSRSVDSSTMKAKSVTSGIMRLMSLQDGEVTVTAAAPKASSTTSGIQITTVDAYTLTDGPTIFLTDDSKKIANFCIQQSNISESVFSGILIKLAKNNEIVREIARLENFLEEEQKKTTYDSGSRGQKITKDSGEYAASGKESNRLSKESAQLNEQITKLRKEIRSITLDPIYVPNTRPHQERWAPGGQVYENAFLPTIDETITKKIMTLDIENNLKVLLLLGIGVFLENPNMDYMETMKELADTQRLFIIIAASDYIYGTNYQFCHGFIGKDLTNMTQQKILQAMGRIGRNHIQQDYTVRFREDAMIEQLFQYPARNLEAENMCRLFISEAEE
jgi:hypothetical protein